MNTHSYLIWRLVFSRSGGLVRKERQAWEVTNPAGWVPSESALRQTWSIRSGKSRRAWLVWVVLPDHRFCGGGP